MAHIQPPRDDRGQAGVAPLYHVPAVKPDRSTGTCLVQLLALIGAATAFLLNGVAAYLLCARSGFLFDASTLAAFARNRLWFDRPDRWIVLMACVVLNLGYLLALRGRWPAWVVLLWSLLNIVALTIFQTLVSAYIHHG
ncbi:MAG TPA: hypothetical protein VD886_05350 [Herpetosiphonaceae bacterium]|nr:hypothetical protein [Herpetosiphonaceae bacterium]